MESIPMNFPPIAYIAFISIVLPFVLSVILWRRFLNDTWLLIILYGAYTEVLFIQLTLALRRINNLWSSHVYEVLELVLIVLMYRMWVSSKNAKTVYLWIAMVYAVFWLTARSLLVPSELLGLYTPVLSRVLVVAGSLYILFEITSADAERSLLFEPKFWFASGFLAAASGDLMFYAFDKFITGFSFEDAKRVYSIHWAVTVISNLMVVIGILCKPRQRTSGGLLELAP